MQDSSLELLKGFEGFCPKAYKCPAGVWTIGYGSTFYIDGSKVKQGDVIFEEHATKLLEKVVNSFENSVKRLTENVTLNPNQHDALTLFVYNIGVSAFKKSTLLRMVKNNPDDAAIGTQFMRWTRANGRVLPGLVKRRNAESALYFKKWD
jgi:lysozyme